MVRISALVAVVLQTLLLLSVTVEAVDGFENIKISQANNVQMGENVKISNLEESMETFQPVENNDIKIEQIKMDSTQGFQQYVSPEVKRQQLYKHYNNTYMYVTFREKFVSKPDSAPQDTEANTRELYQSVIVDYLNKAQVDEGKLKGINLGNVTLKQALDQHVIFTVNDLKDLKKIANNLKLRKEVLAVEFLDKKTVFGSKAGIDEMSSFKSKVKRQAIIYDPEKVNSQKEKEEKEKREQEELERQMAEAMKSDKVRVPQPFMGHDHEKKAGSKDEL